MQRKHMQLFQDPEFPPQVAIGGTDIAEGKYKYYWMPASCCMGHSMDSRMPLFANQSSDMDQGAIGNCWLIAAFVGLKNCAPEWVKSLFETVTEDGKYVIRLYHPSGKAYRITIDEYVPVRLTSRCQYEPFFCRPQAEIWPLLFEKAMAKMYGSYGGMLTNSLPGQGGFCLTGKIPKLFRYDKHDNLWHQTDKWTKIRDGDETIGFKANPVAGDAVRKTSLEFGLYLVSCVRGRHMMCASTIADGESCRQVGLLEAHMYSITQVRIVKDCQSPRHFFMIRLRNPHGRTRWTGNWSDESPFWHRFPDVAKALNFRPVPTEESHLANGRFWMEVHDFIHYFSVVEVTRPPQLLANKQDVQRCPGGHVLQQFPTQSNGFSLGFSCDLCHKSVPIGTEMLSCRLCDYDLCLVCSQKRSATCRGSISPRRDLPPSPRANKHDNEKRRSVTPRRSLSPRRDLPPSSPRTKEEDEKRRATPRQSIFKSVLDVVRGRTPPPGFRKRTPPPGGWIR